MDKNKDYIDNIIDSFCDIYESEKKTMYAIGRGKKHYYPGAERAWVGNLISIYRSTKPDADTQTALEDFRKLFQVILKHKYSSAYLQDVTLYKVCFKLNEYREAIRNPQYTKKGFDPGKNHWNSINQNTLLIENKTTTAVCINKDKFYSVTKLPVQNITVYSLEELDIIKDELLRFAAARDENFTLAVIEEWIKCFEELGYSVSKVVKSIRLAKLQPKFNTTEFAIFTQINTDEYYQKYPHKKL